MKYREYFGGQTAAEEEDGRTAMRRA